MGTNFYWYHESEVVHIGKCSGTERGLEFQWAVEPEQAVNHWAFDEYGRFYGPAELADVLIACPLQPTDMIGMEFS